MADKNVYITNNNTSPAREEYYTKKSAQLDSYNRTQPLRRASKFHMPSILIPGRGNIFMRLLGVIIVLLVLASIMRLAGQGHFEYTQPTFSSLLEYFSKIQFPAFNLSIEFGSLHTGIYVIDYVAEYLINLFEGIFTIIGNVCYAFSYIINVISFLASWLFGISFTGIA